MQSRRDQVQAHMFVMGRLTSGMLRADPDAPESPVGRTNRGMVWGAVAGVVLVVGFLLFGMISPAGTKTWRQDSALIVQKDTGTRYLYLGGVLRPIRNYASAKLIAADRLTPVQVSAASLTGERHGPPVGIPGAPDALPGPADLEQGPWTVCAEEPRRTGADGSERLPVTSLRVGPASDGRALGAGQAVMVRSPDGTRFLLWGDHRLRLGGHGALQALGYAGAPVLPVSAAFLDGVPAGTDLAAPEVAGRGTAGPALGSGPSRTGQVYALTSPGATRQHYLLERDGLRPVSVLTAALVLGDDRTAKLAYPGRTTGVLPLSAAQLTQHQAKTSVADPDGWPTRVPAVRDPGAATSLCARLQPEGTTPRVSVTLGPSGAPLPPPVSGQDTAPACLAVDALSVRPGGGALVQALGAGGSPIGTTTYLVTDVGVKYRLPDATSLERLGLKGGRAQAVPSRLLDMLPTGPVLDAAVARGETKAQQREGSCR
ncbi:type VII secretion protein EccB [Streptomyces sp. NPDC001941]|uniref:type VII secretion protein EccB n=1 Tax=Streptomyces sp. NPDC001941 TaxID=3154659 RepID=UPI0033223381